MSKKDRYLTSPEILSMLNYKTTLRLPLFIQKSNDEGIKFYYMGDMTPNIDTIKEAKIKNKKGVMKPVVTIKFKLSNPVDDTLYNYLTNTLD